jgi:hypothetical protein
MKNADKTSAEIANHLGVTTATIRTWRKRIADEDITCGYGVSGCGKCIHNPRQNTP